MKNYVIIFLFSLSVGLMSCEKDKETILTDSQFPIEIVKYVETHYPEDTILQVIEEYDDGLKVYEALLKSGIKLEFNQYFQLIDIDG